MHWIKIVVCPVCGSMKEVLMKQVKWKCPRCKKKLFVKDTVWKATKIEG